MSDTREVMARQVREYMRGVRSIPDPEVEVNECTWEFLYPCMFLRHLVLVQHEVLDAPRTVCVEPKGPAAWAYVPEHYYVMRTSSGDVYLGSCSSYVPSDEDFRRGVVVKKYEWRLPVADPTQMMVDVKFVPVETRSYIKLDTIVRSNGVDFSYILGDDK